MVRVYWTKNLNTERKWGSSILHEWVVLYLKVYLISLEIFYLNWIILWSLLKYEIVEIASLFLGKMARILTLKVTSNSSLQVKIKSKFSGKKLKEPCYDKLTTSRNGILTQNFFHLSVTTFFMFLPIILIFFT